MPYDATLSRAVDYIRFKCGDINDDAPIMPGFVESTYSALITKFGERMGAYHAAKTLAGHFSTINYTDNDVREDLKAAAERYDKLAQEFLSDPTFTEPSGKYDVLGAGDITYPDLSEYRTD